MPAPRAGLRRALAAANLPAEIDADNFVRAGAPTGTAASHSIHAVELITQQQQQNLLLHQTPRVVPASA